MPPRTFEVKGRWEGDGDKPPMNYDFWYQPRRNVLISSEFGEPSHYEHGFDPEDVVKGHYGHRLHTGCTAICASTTSRIPSTRS